ncbi:PAS domain S-box protein [Deltaproteobacteria bacterium TL4]
MMSESQNYEVTVMTDLVVTISKDGKILDVNVLVCDLLGYTREELIQKPFDMIVSKKDFFEYASYRDIFALGCIINVGAQYVAKDGSEVPILLSSRVEKDRVTQTERGVCIAQNVSAISSMQNVLSKTNIELEERVEALNRDKDSLLKQSLKNQQTRKILQAIVEGTSSDVGIDFFRSLVKTLSLTLEIRCAFVGKIDKANPRQMQMLAIWTGELFAEPITFDIKGSPFEKIDRPEIFIFPEGIQSHYPDSIFLKTRDIESLLSFPLLNSSNEMMGVLAVMHDHPMENTSDIESFVKIFATRAESEMMRQEMEKDRDRLATAIDQAVEAIVITDEKGRIQYTNPAFEKVSGFTSSEVLGQTSRLLKSGKQPSFFYKEMWETIAQGKVWSGRIINRKKDGSLYDEEMTISPIRDHRGNISNFVGVKRDITYEVQLEKQLRQSQKMEALGTMAEGIAHDFNNLLFAMLGYIEMVRDDTPEGSLNRKNLEEALIAGKRAKNLVAQILSFSQDAELHQELIQITPIIEESIRLLRPSFPETLEIIRDLETKSGHILADSTQVQQILMNLCLNARASMQDSGILEIGLKRVVIKSEFAILHDIHAGPAMKLSIKDTGTGIDPAIIDRIFDPFFTTKAVNEGTGLGLSIVHGIIKKHNGAITVNSELGKGTIFEIYFPLVETGNEEGAYGHLTSRGTERLLFVDDEELLVTMFSQALGELGYHVTAMMSSMEALEFFRLKPDQFDLVITDQMMPEMSGNQLAENIRLIRSDIPIMMLTGYKHNVSSEYLRQIGIQECLVKPIEMSQLSSKIRYLLDAHLIKKPRP